LKTQGQKFGLVAEKVPGSRFSVGLVGVCVDISTGEVQTTESARRWAPVVTASNSLESAQAGGCSD